MTDYAEIKNGIVTNVIICDEENIKNYDGEWVKVIGKIPNKTDTYDSINNKFIPIKPFESWVPFEDKWKAPKQHPLDGQLYKWNELAKGWEIKGQNDN